MIELKHVHKWFNRGRANSIHVINDADLTIGDTGLVAILGSSGSGKTTLLNAIGGLDKVNRGKIYINGKKINRFSSNATDNIRNLNIGYIFQNYHLLDEKTVYENVALALRMIGIRRKADVSERVEAVLNAVDMYRFRNRPAEMLSGGQRQRVAIARALVKDPKIIIADEPTGNLDTENSLAIMNMLKIISKKRLVLLVTHEEDLARFYADRILELVDGKIVKDYENIHDDQLDYRLENKIYLKDLPSQEKLKGNHSSLYFFGDNEEPLKILVAYQNGNIYIKANKKVEIIDEQSKMQMVNAHYTKIKKDDVSDLKFQLPDNSKFRLRYHSIFNIFNLLFKGIRQVLHYKLLKKVLLLGFVVASMFVLYSVSNYTGIKTIRKSDYIEANETYVSVLWNPVDLFTFETMEQSTEEKGWNYILPTEASLSWTIPLNDFYQTSQASYTIRGSIALTTIISEEDLIAGRMPENRYEIVVDKMLFENANSRYNLTPQWAGYFTYADYLNKTARINEQMPDFTIVGFTDKTDPSVYVMPDIVYNVLNYSGYHTASVQDYTMVQDKISLTKGRWPENRYETVIPDAYKDYEEYAIGKTVPTEVNGNKLHIVGYYTSPRHLSEFYVSPVTIKVHVITSASEITVSTNDRPAAVAYFDEMGLQATDRYQTSYDNFMRGRDSEVRSTVILAAIILGISLIEIYLMIRSSFLSRVKEVGTYRAIGLKKGDIYKMFLGEILAITIITSSIGLFLMANILRGILQMQFMQQTYVLNWQVIGISALIILVFNCVAGLLPVWSTLRKTPAAILARIDVD